MLKRTQPFMGGGKLLLLALLLTFFACQKDDDLQKTTSGNGSSKLLTLSFDVTTTTQVSNPDQLKEDIDLAYGMPIRTREKVHFEVFSDATANWQIEALDPEEPIFDLTTGNFIPADESTITKTVITGNSLKMYNKKGEVLHQGPFDADLKALVQDLREVRDSFGTDNLNSVLQFFNPQLFKGNLTELVKNPSKFGAHQIDINPAGEIELRTGNNSIVALEMDGSSFEAENPNDKATIIVDTTKNVLLASTYHDQEKDLESGSLYFYDGIDGNSAFGIQAILTAQDKIMPSGTKVTVEQLQEFSDMEFTFE